MRAMLGAVAVLVAVSLSMVARAEISEVDVTITYLWQDRERPPTLSNLDAPPDSLGVYGARLAVQDNLTTGTFLGHAYVLNEVRVPVGGNLASASRDALAASPFLVLDVSAAGLLQIADLPEAQKGLLFNASVADTVLRSDDCRMNVFHTVPSLAMRADALMQFIRFKRWDNLALISGAHAPDISFAQALRASAHKFGMDVRRQKTWAFDADLRRSAAQEVPLFTQDLGTYDLLLVADELDDFARYIPFNTWLPRPVAGSEGIVPRAWAPVVEQWGAAQLQARFKALSARPMQSRDYAAWVAVRAIGEAVTRTGSADAGIVRDFVLSGDFELAAFKGRPLSFRSWNGQLRQPIPLVTRRAVVAQAPLPGYLHQRNELDTLGLDLSESNCKAFQ